MMMSGQHALLAGKQTGKTQCLPPAPALPPPRIEGAFEGWIIAPVLFFCNWEGAPLPAAFMPALPTPPEPPPRTLLLPLEPPMRDTGNGTLTWFLSGFFLFLDAIAAESRWTALPREPIDQG